MDVGACLWRVSSTCWAAERRCAGRSRVPAAGIRRLGRGCRGAGGCRRCLPGRGLLPGPRYGLGRWASARLYWAHAWAEAAAGVTIRAMAWPGCQRHAVRLLGRNREHAAIDAVLAGAGAALVAPGEAVIGTSALLDYARLHAPPVMVQSPSGVEAGSDLASARPDEPLRPVRPGWLVSVLDRLSCRRTGASRYR